MYNTCISARARACVCVCVCARWPEIQCLSTLNERQTLIYKLYMYMYVYLELNVHVGYTCLPRSLENY